MATQLDDSARIFNVHSLYSEKARSSAILTESADDGDDRPGGGEAEGRTKRGLSMGLTSLFLMAEMAGAGVLNLPRAVANTGWTGLPLMMVMGLGVGFAGTRLGRCWMILEERWPQYRAPCSRPYPAIAFRAFGKPGQMLAEASLVLTLFGGAIVYLLFASQIIHDLLGDLLPPLSQCAWTLILGVLLCPTTWLSTPKDFWGAPIFALSATIFACLVLVVEVIVNDHEPPVFPAPTFKSFFLGFSAITFAFGGSSIFPTIQNDMKDRSQFPHSVVITFLVLLAIYLPVCCICYGILGGKGVLDNILDAVKGPAVKVTQVFIVCHFLFAFAIIINPVNQTLESFLKVPREVFGVRRVVVRSCVAAMVILVAFTVPDFGKILDLLGGSTITMTSFVLPPTCYLRLNAAKDIDGVPYRILPKWEVVALWVVTVVGMLGGVASTYSALYTIITEQSFASTCFSPQSFL